MLNAVQSVTSEFQKAAMLIAALAPDDYSRSSNGTGSVGGHVRHNLDFLDILLKGIETGEIDYNRRERDQLIESDLDHARARITESVEKLKYVTQIHLNRFVRVRSEVEPNIWHPSSVGREMEFIHSHTVHHHALIREKLASNGIGFHQHFGVAPSTIAYWAGQAH